LVFAVAIPVLALAGFAVAGRATGDIMSDPEAMAVLKARSNWPNAEYSAALAWLRTGTRIGFLAILASVAVIFTSRRMLRLSHKPGVQISYVDGPTIQLSPGTTLLEGSRSANIPHASLCGGRGRCSTCRVRIVQGLDSLPSPVGAEAITLQSIEANPNIRLACQIKPSAKLTVAIVSHPATPGPPQADFLELKEIVAAHVRAVLDSRQVEFESSDPIAVSRWAEQKTTVAVPVRNLTSRGFSLQGARLDYFLSRPAIALVYARQAHPISVFVLPNSEAQSVAMRGQRGTYRVLAWTDAGWDHLAVSDLPARELDRLQVALLETASMSEMVS
jgi:ferredoxin